MSIHLCDVKNGRSGLTAASATSSADRSIHFLKGLVKKVLRRSLDHHQRERRPSTSNQLSG